MAEEQAIAVLTIKRASEMTPEGREAIAKWLRHQASELVNEGANYADRFRARYIASEKE